MLLLVLYVEKIVPVRMELGGGRREVGGGRWEEGGGRREEGDKRREEWKCGGVEIGQVL